MLRLSINSSIKKRLRHTRPLPPHLDYLAHFPIHLQKIALALISDLSLIQTAFHRLPKPHPPLSQVLISPNKINGLKIALLNFSRTRTYRSDTFLRVLREWTFSHKFRWEYLETVGYLVLFWSHFNFNLRNMSGSLQRIWGIFGGSYYWDCTILLDGLDTFILVKGSYEQERLVVWVRVFFLVWLGDDVEAESVNVSI